MPDSHFADRLQAAIEAKGAPICAGLDPRPDWIPPEFFETEFSRQGRTPAAVRAAVKAFCLEVLRLVAPLVPAVKPQAAFFEALGPQGLADFADLCRAARELGLIVIADVKRGDIGSTAEAYAQSLFGAQSVQGVNIESMRADAATINPYLGADGVLPFIDRAQAEGAGVYILARTSNPGSAEFQQLELKQGGSAVDEIARKISTWGQAGIGQCGYSDVGAVVGATHAEAAARLRGLMPHTPFLVPGWGAQGGSAETVRACFDTRGRGALVNSSRGVMHAYAAGPLKSYGFARWRQAVTEAAAAFKAEIAALLR
ncbi:MAG: orotidine-5'-phosphate decarboxylase [Planctomycetes bacterium]|jgi:orotidine-5'-phosphate decarboxylase|nr:orotidine-5'-phosphate decarboxylase [Planctomycetota bacterium]MCL4730970.1 orotidine-5'-phosphate decarboxylase [Planctomycetota bacterium]